MPQCFEIEKSCDAGKRSTHAKLGEANNPPTSNITWSSPHRPIAQSIVHPQGEASRRPTNPKGGREIGDETSAAP
jgi:hypothetical protein